MPITTLDSNTALIVIDLQKGILALPTCHDTTPIVDKSCQLLSTFREKHLPVCIGEVSQGVLRAYEQAKSHGELPADWSQLVSESNINQAII